MYVGALVLDKDNNVVWYSVGRCFERPNKTRINHKLYMHVRQKRSGAKSKVGLVGILKNHCTTNNFTITPNTKISLFWISLISYHLVGANINQTHLSFGKNYHQQSKNIFKKY